MASKEITKIQLERAGAARIIAIILLIITAITAIAGIICAVLDHINPPTGHLAPDASDPEVIHIPNKSHWWFFGLPDPFKNSDEKAGG